MNPFSFFYLHFRLKHYISWINMNPPGGNFANSAIWHTIVYKVSAFHFLGPKTEWRDTLDLSRKS